MFVLMNIKRIAVYSTLHFGPKMSSLGAPLDAAMYKTTGDNPPIFFHLASLFASEVSAKTIGQCL